MSVMTAVRPARSSRPFLARALLLGGTLAGPVLALSAGAAAAAPQPLPAPAIVGAHDAGTRMPHPDPGSTHDEVAEYGGLSAGRIEAYETYLEADDARSEAMASAFPAGSGVTARHRAQTVTAADPSDGLPAWGVAGTAAVGTGLLVGAGAVAVGTGHQRRRRPVRPA
jgi:hypothetical protein